ncbi:MAG: Gfo/Idh/MocA family oxidoreductase [Clostridia bacterium]|nr:Gfo/Idh/MocA family oxidoreductase [Deltaproteobacteria bacterium]
MKNAGKRSKGSVPSRKIRYAVIGLGHIAQNAMLPAFAHAGSNSQLVALVSGDKEKLAKLGRKYKTPALYSYEQYDECLASEAVDAVYIALPNSLHRDYVVRAAKAGVHVLCEKPLAVTAQECKQIMRVVERHNIMLMVAYRLHFDEANLRAIEIVNSGKIGEPRIFNSQFSMQVRPGNVRLNEALGGGALYDIGIYCINAARYLFRAEPTEVFAAAASSSDKRFAEVDEMVSAVMRFPDNRLATFTCSFGAAHTSRYQVIGTKGDLEVSPAYGYTGELAHRLTVHEKATQHKFAKRDQFAAELVYFSNCILHRRQPEPSAAEGTIDVAIIEALAKSAKKGRLVKVKGLPRDTRPTVAQEIMRPAGKEPELVKVKPPH